MANDVIKCVCNANVESGIMFQCDTCKSYQHGDCLVLPNGKKLSNLSRRQRRRYKHICPFCAPPQNWLPVSMPATPSSSSTFVSLSADPPADEPAPASPAKDDTMTDGTAANVDDATVEPAETAPPEKAPAAEPAETEHKAEEEIEPHECTECGETCSEGTS